MKMQLVGENRGSDLESLPEYEADYKEGDRGEIRLYLSEPIDTNTIRQIEDELLSQGVALTENIRQDAGILAIRFRKSLAPLAIVAIVVGGLVVVAGILIGWQIFRLKYAGVPTWVIVVGAAAALYLILTSKPAKATGRAAVGAGKWAGKRYVEKKIGGMGPELVPSSGVRTEPFIIPPNHQISYNPRNPRRKRK